MTLNQQDVLSIKGVMSEVLSPLYSHISAEMDKAREDRKEMIAAAIKACQQTRLSCEVRADVDDLKETVDGIINKGKGVGWTITKLLAVFLFVVSAIPAAIQGLKSWLHH